MQVELVDLGTAPEIHIDGLGRITRNNGIVKYALYSTREVGGGKTENVIVAYIVASTAVACAIHEEIKRTFSPGARFVAEMTAPILFG